MVRTSVAILVLLTAMACGGTAAAPSPTPGVTFTMISTVSEYYSMPSTGWYVNVHKGPDFTEADYAPSVSCGDLPAF